MKSTTMQLKTSQKLGTGLVALTLMTTSLTGLGASKAGAVEVAKLPPPDSSRTPGAPTCVTGSYLTKYISVRLVGRPDHSFTRFTWQSRFCRQGNDWQPSGEPPKMESLSAGSLGGVGIDLQSPRYGPNYIEYRGRVRQCTPLGAGYQGISYTGFPCYTAGNVTIRAEVRGNSVRYSTNVTTTKSGSGNLGAKLEWSNRAL